MVVMPKTMIKDLIEKDFIFIVLIVVPKIRNKFFSAPQQDNTRQIKEYQEKRQILSRQDQNRNKKGH